MSIKVDGPEVFGVAQTIWAAQGGKDAHFEASWESDPIFRQRWAKIGCVAFECAAFHISNKMLSAIELTGSAANVRAA